MPQHISRKELKKDNIREGLVHGAEVVAHDKQIWLYAAIAIVIAGAIIGWRFYTQSQSQKASLALADAMTVYQARVRAPGDAPPGPGELTYIDEKNRDLDASKKFAAVASRYGRTYSGELARYYNALCLEVIGRDADAQAELTRLESSSDAGIKSLAEYQLAQIDDRTGKGDQAVKLYQELEDKPSLFVPKAVAMLSLADHYSSTDPTRAAEIYAQIKTEFPDTEAAQTADQHLQLLPAKS